MTPKAEGRDKKHAPSRKTDRRAEQLQDRRDYRQALIHRLATAHGVRKAQLEEKLAAVEGQIKELRTEKAA